MPSKNEFKKKIMHVVKKNGVKKGEGKQLF